MNGISRCAAILAAAIGSATAVAQGPTLLKNFNTKPLGNYYSGTSTAWAQLGTKAFITFTTHQHGNELWTYDAAERSLACLTEGLFPGSSAYVGNARHQIAFKGAVYFTAWSAKFGRELYKTDGTVAGTRLLKDIMPGNPEGGPFTSGPLNFVVFGDQLIFTADDGSAGLQLWKTDGSSEGTTLLGALPVAASKDDAAPAPAFARPRARALPSLSYAAIGPVLFFTCRGKLCRLTLSPDTITAISPDEYDDAQQLAVLGTDLLFAARATDPDDTVGLELYRSDGETITLAEDILPAEGESSSPGEFTTYGGRLYFAAARAQDPNTPRRRDVELFEYYRDPGTGAWVLTGLDINRSHDAGDFTNSSYPGQFVETNGTLFFTADDGINGCELWTITPGGIHTAAMLELDPKNPGGIHPGDAGALSSRSAQLTVLNDTKIVFVADDGETGNELWESDGTPAGTVLCGDYLPGGDGTEKLRPWPSMGGSLILFRGDNNNGWGSELHAYQGNPNRGEPGTLAPVADVNPQGDRDGPGGFHNAEGVVDLGNGYGLFAAEAHDAEGNSLGVELWRSDGTAAGTVLVKDIIPGAGSGSPRDFCRAGDLMYFQAAGEKVGHELFFSNGVPEGMPGHACGLAVDLNLGGASGRPQHLTCVGGDRIVLATNDGMERSPVLYWVAGTEHGMITHQVTEDGARVASPIYAPSSMQYHDGRVFLSGGSSSDNTRTYDLYSTDGSTATRLTELKFQQAAHIVHFDDAGSKVYFNGYYRDALDPDSAKDIALGWQLWVADSAFKTPPVRLTNEATVSEFGEPIGVGASQFADLNGKLFFRGASVDSGGELWTTDGTHVGTAVLMDINPGTGDSGFGAPYVIDAGMVFAADDGIHGMEMWLSDGTVEGTRMIADTIPGAYPAGDGAPSWVTPIGSRHVVYRYGRYTEFGSELWACDGTAPRRLTDVNPGNGDSEPYAWTLLNGHLVFEAIHRQTGNEAYTMPFGEGSE